MKNTSLNCKLFILVLSFIVTSLSASAQQETTAKGGDDFDLYSDTWVAMDALGRTMPDFKTVGPVKTDHRRVVGIFYVTWHTSEFLKKDASYKGDVDKILAAHPEARLDANKYSLKKTTNNWIHWGEPEPGYFLSRDKYVIREDISMLNDAGVDVLILDVTNAVLYYDEWYTLFETMHEMKAEGNKVPKICFWAYNGPVLTVVQDLYEKIYKQNKYSDLWFYWDGKPLMLCNMRPQYDANGGGVDNPNPHYDAAAATDTSNPHYMNPDYTAKSYTDYTQEVKSFFTMRNLWWGYYEWQGKRYIGTEDNWCFGYEMEDSLVRALPVDSLGSRHNGLVEETAVTPAQHPISMTGKSWSRAKGEPKLNEYDLPVPTYVPWLGKTVKHPEGYGIYFQERWDEALKLNPQFLYLNDWNEISTVPCDVDSRVSKTPYFNFMGRKSTFYFLDQYNAEFNRTIRPMKGGYTDNYYMQMAQNIRRYKGVRPIPVNNGLTPITIDGNFSDWSAVTVEYRDTKGDVMHRDYPGYAGNHYINNSGRNDIIISKVAVDNDNVYFYVQTSKDITSRTDKNWMLLFINADQNYNTGWYGYDYIINKKVIDGGRTTIQKYNASKKCWSAFGTISYSVKGNQMEIAVPRRLLSLSGDKITFDFKWADNPVELKDPISLCTDGDTAPNRRFNYRCIWQK
jgi:hypothetical protein